MRAHRVRALLMGGQACVFYGAAEFSRDTDLVIVADTANIVRLQKALHQLKAEAIAVPPFDLTYLRRGHAIHFRCFHPEAFRMRVDVMSKMRGVDAFPSLWKRRTVIELPGGITCDLLSLPDLVKAKKTQRDKDWPMIRRLVESHYFENSISPKRNQITFWLLELRTPSLLIEVARRHPKMAKRLTSKRHLLLHAVAGNIDKLESALHTEEMAERRLDHTYWIPLRKDLESLRRDVMRKSRQKPSPRAST